MKKLVVLCLMILTSYVGNSQITIQECYRKAQENYPLIKQYDLIENTKEYNISNANKGYLPQVMFSAKASYQSDVTQLPIDLSQLGGQGMNIKPLSKDQYSANLEVNQTIWDGGNIESQKDKINARAEVEKKNTEVSIYSINERINQLYFGIILTEAQIKQNELLQEELNSNYNKIQSYMNNGLANQADLDAIRVEQLKAEQKRSQINNTKKTFVEMLSKMIGEELTMETEFVKPETIRPVGSIINRPELGLFNAQINEIESKNNEITSSLMPKLGLFITGGYGKPGLNMLENGFSSYYIGGVRLSWNIGNLYTFKNNKSIINTNIKAVETQRETFLFNTQLDIAQKNNTIDNYTEQLKYDDEIIALRGSVKRASEAKMANGTISGTDLSRDINAEQLAIQDKILHETELLLAIYNLKFALNN